MHARVKLDRYHRASLRREPFRQAAGTGADLEHQIVKCQFGALDQNVEKVNIDQKALTERGTGTQLVLSQQLLDVSLRVPSG